MKCPFIKNKYYTCITKSEDDRGMEFLELFRCSNVIDSNKFDTNLQKDDSRIKFINKNGNEVSYFGSIAIKCFSDDETIIQNNINWYLNFYSTELNSTYTELLKNSQTILKRVKDYVRYKNELEKLSKKNGFSLFDFTKLGDELEAFIDHFEKCKLSPLQEFKLSNTYLELSLKYKDGVYVWKTTEGIFECTLDALVETLNKDKLYSGHISELKIIKINERT
jgi:hypothetical protein